MLKITIKGLGLYWDLFTDNDYVSLLVSLNPTLHLGDYNGNTECTLFLFNIKAKIRRRYGNIYIESKGNTNLDLR